MIAACALTSASTRDASKIGLIAAVVSSLVETPMPALIMVVWLPLPRPMPASMPSVLVASVTTQIPALLAS